MALGALAQATRMRVFRLLATAGAEGLPSGEIADLVGIPRNLMSSHLAILRKAGLLVARQQGRVVRYAADRLTVERLSRHLAELAALRGGDASSGRTTGT